MNILEIFIKKPLKMKTKSKHFDRVYAFFEGEMNEAEKLAFEKELNQNSELKKEFELQKSLNQFLNDKDTLSYHNTLENIEHEIEQQAQGGGKKKTSKLILYAAAAVILILVASIIVSQLYVKKMTNDELFAQYYKFTYSGELSRSGNDNISTLSEGLIQYDLHHYDNAIIILEKVLLEDTENVKAKFYLSMAYIETGKFDKAIQNLESISGKKNHILIDKIKWYLALSYIKVENNQEAIKAFEELANSSYYCNSKAKEILEKLK